MKFSEPSFRKDFIITITAIVLAQAIVIGWLLFERRRRQKAELELRRRVLETIHMNRTVVASALSGSIAHELVQPLGAVVADTETAKILLAVRPPDIDQVQAVVDHIGLANTRAVEIIQHFRQLLKRPNEVHSLEVDMNKVIADAVHIVSPEAKKRSVILEVKGTLQRPLVRGDHIQLQQVILNLILNGMDAMADVAPDARLMTIRWMLVDKKVEVSIIDNGVGIRREQLREVFNSFFTTKPQGTGLGLSIARTIVQTHGGEIWAESGTSSGGAIFRFTLPLAEVNSS